MGKDKPWTWIYNIRWKYIIAFSSRSNNNVKSNYSSLKAKALAVIWTIAHFLPYLYSQYFILIIDHQPLK
uniref:Reverse transcriptase RNase H-like domain-containing protein n=1 Tax=Physcomitrium patens TaxID=3218 RepID=A0A2K1J0K5_PHYPA|nr:hypothetical protein PHYPA_022957 [Physcomitrium patens]